MGLFDDVKSFFGMGDDAPQGPVTVPIPGEGADPNDPEVQAAQAAFTAACQKEDAIKAREPEEQAKAEARRTQEWTEEAERARRNVDAAQARYDQAKASQNLPANAGKDKVLAAPQVDLDALSRALAAAQAAAKRVETYPVFCLDRPVQKYLDARFQEELKQAGLERMAAHERLQQAKVRAASRART